MRGMLQPLEGACQPSTSVGACQVGPTWLVLMFDSGRAGVGRERNAKKPFAKVADNP
jgi:hypothetical protein